MGFYLFAFFLLLLGTVVAGNNNILGKSNVAITRFTGLLFILFTGLRAATVGNDTPTYLSLFKSVSIFDASNFLKRYEIGFIYFIKVLSKISTNPQILLFVSGVVIWLCVVYFFNRNSDNPLMSFFILLGYGFVAFFMSGIRESIAIAICLIAFEFVKNKKLLLFVSFTILASLFHTSALIFLIAYPVYWIRFTRKTRVLLLLISGIASVSLDKIISFAIGFFPRYAMYLNTKYNNGDIRLASVINMAIVLIIYYIGTYYYRRFEMDENNNGILNLTYIGALILLVSFNFNLLDRIGNYFTIFISVVIPNIICNRYNRNRRIIAAIAMICFLLYFVTIQLFRPEWNTIRPYGFFWS